MIGDDERGRTSAQGYWPFDVGNLVGRKIRNHNTIQLDKHNHDIVTELSTTTKTTLGETQLIDRDDIIR
jgi:hypothetical protein